MVLYSFMNCVNLVSSVMTRQHLQAIYQKAIFLPLSLTFSPAFNRSESSRSISLPPPLFLFLPSSPFLPGDAGILGQDADPFRLHKLCRSILCALLSWFH
uniref:Uncharacterized protein n=1 Tax=Anguilla anguilla TaxID=7936 RepID=A0A0E9WT44_ANGAN